MPGTIDERVLKFKPKNKEDITENHNLFINSAIGIGCPNMTSISKELFNGSVRILLFHCLTKNL